MAAKSPNPNQQPVELNRTGIVIEEIIEERYRAKNYNVERFIFKSK